MIKTFEQYKNKLNVALFGGAFDPIHNGHMQIAEQVLHSGGVDEVWLLPDYFHLIKKEMASSIDRLNMCKIATKNHKGIKVFDYSIRYKLEGELYYSMKKLLSDPEYERYNFSFVIGLDNAIKIQNWYKNIELREMMPFIVLSRGGVNISSDIDWFLYPPHKFIKCDALDISSTEIRNMLNHKNIRLASHYLDGDVINYIFEHKIYM